MTSVGEDSYNCRGLGRWKSGNDGSAFVCGKLNRFWSNGRGGRGGSEDCSDGNSSRELAI